MRERGPVLNCGRLDGGGFEVGIRAIAGTVVPNDELLDGLRAVEEAGAGGGDNGDTAATREDDVALVVHGGIEGEVRGSEERAGRWCVGTKQLDDGTAGVGRNAALLQRGAEIVGGEAVLGVERAGADEDAVVEREDGSGLHLARHGDEAEGGGGLRVEGQASNGCEQRDVPPVAVKFSRRRGRDACHQIIVRHRGMAAVAEAGAAGSDQNRVGLLWRAAV